ncbi:MAG: MBL fold metallo-hydrolase [Burkholderiales bacterium]
MPGEAVPAKRVPIRLACTIVLMRDGAPGLEVLLLRRVASAAFLGGAYVFPGGAVDASDSHEDALSRVRGITREEARARLALEGDDALRHWVAAVRECFEESGVLLARDAAGRPVDAERTRTLQPARKALHAGTVSFAEFLRAEDLFVHGDDLAYADHWITPAGRPRRFDTRFFWARAPHGHQESADRVETVHAEWVAPHEALARVESGAMEVAFATAQVLRGLARWPRVDDALAHARGLPGVETTRPVIAQGSRGPVIFRRGDAAYEEVRWSDPEETTVTTYDIVPGVAKRLDEHVARIVAPNPSVMTGPGTNTYLVGRDELAVIDPGPDLDAHVEAIVREGAGRIRWIFCTHTHVDHSPAALKLKALTGATLIGARPAFPDRQDATFSPDVVPTDGATYAIGDLVLEAVHTPGHASNHFCYQLRETCMLWSGDHVMQGSTVIINPPDGDMRAYLVSLHKLLARDIAIIAPGHGYLIGHAHDEIRRLVAHRLQREARVLEALARLAPCTVEAMVPGVYADVPADRHRAAARSLLAHLAKLVAEGTVREENGRYALAAR